MDRYLGSKCPYCEKEFQPGDDIVVCPDCGTPYHRSCWQEHGVCVYQDRHGSYEWKPELPFHAADPQNTETAYCPNCGAPVAPDAKFCPSCGTTFGQTSSAGQPSPFGGSYAGQAGVPGTAAFSPDVRVFGDEEPIGDFPAKEYAAFVGKNQRYFLPRFKLFSEGRHNSFNIAAFLFGYLYLFYRKMYGLGAVVLLLTFLLDLPSLAASYADLQQALINAGALSGAVFSIPNDQLLSSLSTVGGILLWCIKAGLLVLADRYYFHFSTAKIRSLKETYPESGMYEAGLLRKGGTSVALVILSIIVIAAASYVPFYMLVSSPLFDLTKFVEFATSYGAA